MRAAAPPARRRCRRARTGTGGRGGADATPVCRSTSPTSSQATGDSRRSLWSPSPGVTAAAASRESGGPDSARHRGPRPARLTAPLRRPGARARRARLPAGAGPAGHASGAAAGAVPRCGSPRPHRAATTNPTLGRAPQPACGEMRDEDGGGPRGDRRARRPRTQPLRRIRARPAARRRASSGRQPRHGPCGGGPTGSRGRRGCASAAGSRGSSPVGGCSAGTSACSRRGLQSTCVAADSIGRCGRMHAACCAARAAQAGTATAVPTGRRWVTRANRAASGQPGAVKATRRDRPGSAAGLWRTACWAAAAAVSVRGRRLFPLVLAQDGDTRRRVRRRLVARVPLS